MCLTKKLDNEHELILSTQQNLKQFEPLYDFYYLPVYRFLYKRTNNKDTAGEVTSIVFVKVLENIHKYTFTGAPFSSWLFCIAQNALNDLFRKNKITRTVDVNTSQLEALIDNEELCNKEDRIESLLRLIPELKIEEITLLELKFFEERRYKEVAEIMEISEENARIRIHRLITKMKKMLTG